MTVYTVLYLGTVVGLYTSMVDASTVAKSLPQSTISACKLNSETDTGAQLLSGFIRRVE